MERLATAQTWMYQIQGLDDDLALAALAASDYPMLVIEPGQSFRTCEGFDPEVHGIGVGFRDSACAEPYDTEAIVEALKTTPEREPRLLIAYVSVGEAEWYRDYWTVGWAPPADATAPGTPAYILGADPDDWEGNFVVDYSAPEWQEIWLGNDGIIAELARLGFDGVYLDWVEAYDDERIQSALGGRRKAADAMVTFVEKIRAAGRAVTADFLVIAQNATYLLDDASDGDRYAAAIDALAVEDTWYYGDGAAENWDGDNVADRLACERVRCSEPFEGLENVCPDPAMTEECLRNNPVSGDLHGGLRHGCEAGLEGTSDCWSTENRLAAYARYQEADIPVFSIDYCVAREKAAKVYQAARAAGLRPLVSRVQLSRMTETPPHDFP